MTPAYLKELLKDNDSNIRDTEELLAGAEVEASEYRARLARQQVRRGELLAQLEAAQLKS